MNLDGLDDLARRSAATVNAIARASATDGSQADAVSRPGRHGERRRAWVVLGAAAAIIAALAGWIVTRDGDEQLRTVDVRPTTSPPTVVSTPATPTSAPTTTVTVAPGSWDWLTAAFGVAVPAPTVPDGWEIREVNGLRFATPSEWSVPNTGACETHGAPGAVFINQSSDAYDCMIDVADSMTMGEGIDDPPVGPDDAYGNLRLTPLQAGNCDDCTPRLRGDSFVVRVRGTLRDAILRTFDEPGWLQALRSGPASDGSQWQDVAFSGVRFSVPRDWPLVDVERADPFSGPDACGSALFGQSSGVYLGISSGEVICEPPEQFDLRPFDGIWIREAKSRPAAETVVASGNSGGLDVTVFDGSQRGQAGAIELLVEGGDVPLRITIGVGTDASVARAVLTSIGPTATDP